MPVELKELSGGRILEVHATGKLVANDYVELVPTFERLKQQHGKLRVLFELHDFHGWTAGSLCGVGPVVIAGPLVTSLIAALEGAVFFGGLSALGAALFSVGIPRNSVLRYESALKSGSFLLVVQSTDEELQRIENHLLKANQLHSFEVHPPATPAPAPPVKPERAAEVAGVAAGSSF